MFSAASSGPDATLVCPKYGSFSLGKFRSHYDREMKFSSINSGDDGECIDVGF